MTLEDNHNHYCIYCGAKISDDQKFCIKCGKKILRDEIFSKKIVSKYVDEINDLENEFEVKQKRARELVEKLFAENHITHDKFMSNIIKSNELFYNQLDVAKNIVDLNNHDNPFVESEILNKIKILNDFTDKMDDLINELVIHLSSNNEDVSNFFEDMDDLIKSVKDY